MTSKYYYTILRSPVSTFRVEYFYFTVGKVEPVLGDTYHCIISDFRNQTELIRSIFASQLHDITNV